MDSLSNILADEKRTYLHAMNASTLDDAFLSFDAIAPPATAESTLVTCEPAAMAATNFSDLQQILYGLKKQIDSAIKLLESQKLTNKTPESPTLYFDLPQKKDNGAQILEGLFNGEKMIAEDGKKYAVPPNYASKSKLVEGDFMKLTITPAGSFIYKQVGPVARERLMGKLVKDSLNNSWLAETSLRTYKILTASITFYRARLGDKVVFLVPRGQECSWGAVDNIICE